jgi:gluconolactonase
VTALGLRGSCALALLLAAAVTAAAPAVATGAPRGEVLKLTLTGSTLFPGQTRDYWVYVPAQYRPDRAACLYVGVDGLPAGAAAVLDRLIHDRAMPVTIAVFVAPAAGAFERSLEHDSPGDGYARFLVEELLPDVERRQASDGRALRVSRDAGDRALGGSGSGAFAALNAAWERPAEWTRVWSDQGAYLGKRGGDRLATLLRKREARPLRVVLDADRGRAEGEHGDLTLANQVLERALAFAGYDVRASWRAGVRRGPASAAAFAQAQRGLWRDWPRPPAARRSGNATLAQLLIPGEDWQLVGQGYRFVEGPAVSARGEVFFNDIPAARTYKVGLDGQVTIFLADSQKANGQAFGPDGRLHAITGGPGKVMAYDAQGGGTPLADGFSGNDLVVAHDGNVYVTNPPDGRDPTAPSRVWLVRPGGSKQVVDSGLRYANGIALSPDQRELYVDDHRSRWVYRYRVQPDGTLADKQRFCALYVPETADDSSADGMKVDVEGRLYVATRTGLLQICDRQGQVVAIIPTPNRRISNVVFGGPRFDILFATAGDRVWKRRLNTVGVNAWAPPR